MPTNPSPSRRSRRSGEIRLDGHHAVNPRRVIRDASVVGLVVVDKVTIVRERTDRVQSPHQRADGPDAMDLDQNRPTLITIARHSFERKGLSFRVKLQLDPMTFCALNPRIGAAKVAAMGGR